MISYTKSQDRNSSLLPRYQQCSHRSHSIFRWDLSRCRASRTHKSGREECNGRRRILGGCSRTRRQKVSQAQVNGDMLEVRRNKSQFVILSVYEKDRRQRGAVRGYPIPLIPRGGYLRQLSLLAGVRRSESRAATGFLSERMKGLVDAQGEHRRRVLKQSAG